MGTSSVLESKQEKARKKPWDEKTTTKNNKGVTSWQVTQGKNKKVTAKHTQTKTANFTWIHGREGNQERG